MSSLMIQVAQRNLWQDMPIPRTMKHFESYMFLSSSGQRSLNEEVEMTPRRPSVDSLSELQINAGCEAQGAISWAAKSRLFVF